MSLLEIEDVIVRRGRAAVLHGVDLRVEPEEVVALLGANGVGKSTVLRTVSGLHKPVSGDIRWESESIAGARAENVVRKGIAHVPEGRQIFAGLTVRENLDIGARIHGGLRQQDIDTAVELFPVIGEMLSRPAGILSGGQQQMLAIARGLMSRPRLLLLDEPSLGLAPKVVADIGAIIRRLPSLGIAVLLVEQNATLALDVASRGYLMAGGRIALEGDAEGLRGADAVREVYLGRRA